MQFRILIVTSCALLACSVSDDDGHTGALPDANPGPCGFDDRYLPFQPGYNWTYQITALGAPATTTKSQDLAAATDPDLGEVILQTTTKEDGTIVSALRLEDDVVVRLTEEHFDLSGTQEDRVVYDPGKERLDESPDKLFVGASWESVYTIKEFDSAGIEVSSGSRSDHWEVIGLDVPCSSPLGEFECLHLRKLRVAGGVNDKQFFFARGIGKVKTVSANEVEELVSCE